MNQREDILSNGGLEGLSNYQIFKRKTPGNKKYSLMNKKFLDMWYIKIIENNNPKINFKYWVCVAGLLKDGTFIESSPIIDVESPRVVVSENSRYHLEYTTFIQKKLPHPSFNTDELNKFFNGFPKDWKSILREQILIIYGDSCIIHDSTNNSFYGNIPRTQELFEICYGSISKNFNGLKMANKAKKGIDASHNIIDYEKRFNNMPHKLYLDDTNISSDVSRTIRRENMECQVKNHDDRRYNRSDSSISFYNQEDFFLDIDLKKCRNDGQHYQNTPHYRKNNLQPFYKPHPSSCFYGKQHINKQANNPHRYQEINLYENQQPPLHNYMRQELLNKKRHIQEKDVFLSSERYFNLQNKRRDNRLTNEPSIVLKNFDNQTKKKKEVFRNSKQKIGSFDKEIKKQDFINSSYPVIKIKGGDIAAVEFSAKCKEINYSARISENEEVNENFISNISSNKCKIKSDLLKVKCDYNYTDKVNETEVHKSFSDKKKSECEPSMAKKNINLSISENNYELPMLDYENENSKNINEVHETVLGNNFKENDKGNIYLDESICKDGSYEKNYEDILDKEIKEKLDTETIFSAVKEDRVNKCLDQIKDEIARSKAFKNNKEKIRRRYKSKNRKSVDISAIINSLTEDDIKNTSCIINPCNSKGEEEQNQASNVLLKQNVLLNLEKEEIFKFNDENLTSINVNNAEPEQYKKKSSLIEISNEKETNFLDNFSEKELIHKEKEINLSEDFKFSKLSSDLDEIMSVNLSSIEDSCETNISQLSDCSFKRKVGNSRKRKSKKCMPRDFKFIEKKLMREEKRTSMSGRTVFYKREE